MFVLERQEMKAELCVVHLDIYFRERKSDSVGDECVLITGKESMVWFSV